MFSEKPPLETNPANPNEIPIVGIGPDQYEVLESELETSTDLPPLVELSFNEGHYAPDLNDLNAILRDDLNDVEDIPDTVTPDNLEASAKKIESLLHKKDRPSSITTRLKLAFVLATTLVSLKFLDIDAHASEVPVSSKATAVEIDTKESSLQQFVSQENVQLLLDDLPVYKKLLEENYSITFRFSRILALKGLAGVFRRTGSFQGELILNSQLPAEELPNLRSIVRHELDHGQQDYLLQRFEAGDSTDLPRWKYDFLQANEDGAESLGDYHIGAELEATFNDVVMQHDEGGKVNHADLVGFFTYFMKIYFTDAFRNHQEVKDYVDYLEAQVTRMSGYTLESFIAEFETKQKEQK